MKHGGKREKKKLKVYTNNRHWQYCKSISGRPEMVTKISVRFAAETKLRDTNQLTGKNH